MRARILELAPPALLVVAGAAVLLAAQPWLGGMGGLLGTSAFAGVVMVKLVAGMAGYATAKA